MNEKLLLALELARKYEACLRPKAHIALTGSTLYGMSASGKDDIDFVIYAHMEAIDDTILRNLPVTIDREGKGSGEGNHPERVRVGRDNASGQRVDFFLFN